MEQKKLIIWDFDGVIADCEHLWVSNWTETLKQLKHIELTKEQQKYYLEGKADKTKMARLQKDYPYLEFDEEFWTELIKKDDKAMKTELKMTPDVMKILDDKTYAQCIATGGNPAKHAKKIFHLNLGRYFTENNTFTAYEVEKGKPAPDIFLYAAQKMGYALKDCIIIEDSIDGLTGAQASGIATIAYIGATGHNNPEYIAQCKKLGVMAISNDMNEVYQLINKYFHD